MNLPNNRNFTNTLVTEYFDAMESAIDCIYFGIPTSKILLKKECSSKDTQDSLIKFMECFSLNMITNKGNDAVNNRWLGERTSAFLTDVNVQFKKTIAFKTELNEQNAVITDCFSEDDQIIHLAETSFRFSRFLNDPYLIAEKAKGIYADIIRNAFGKAGRYFATLRKMGEVCGFLLFSINETSLNSTIELVAIDPNSTGQGIGLCLIKSMEAFVSKKGIETIRVGTQLQNINALKFYSSHGFHIQECSSIYHFWPEKP